MNNEIIREYYKTVKVSMESFRQIGTEYGYTKDFVSGQTWKIQGIQLAFYGMAVRSYDYETAKYISNHSDKIAKRIKKIGAR